MTELAPFNRPAPFPDPEEPAKLRGHDPPDDGRIRVLQVIARLNVGGPALMAAVLNDVLDPGRFDQRIVAGSIGAGRGATTSRSVPPRCGYSVFAVWAGRLGRPMTSVR